MQPCAVGRPAAGSGKLRGPCRELFFCVILLLGVPDGVALVGHGVCAVQRTRTALDCRIGTGAQQVSLGMEADVQAMWFLIDTFHNECFRLGDWSVLI